MTADADRERLGRIIWETSRRDEGTISVTGANIIADAILAAGFRDVAQAWDEGATWAWSNSGDGWNGEYPGKPVETDANPYRE